MAMNDIETALREAMDAAVAGARPPHDPMELVRGQNRRRKVRVAVASAAAAAVVISAAAVIGAVGSTAGRPSSAESSKPSPISPADSASAKNLPPLPRGWTRHADGFGDSIDTPVGWHVQDLSGALFDPVVLWVIGTGPVPDEWNCAPTAALRKLPADGVLVAITEGSSGGGAYPQRPRRLGLGPLGGPFECWGVKTRSLLFEDGGRYFDVQTVFGASAPAILRTELERSLNTLRLTPLAQSSKSALCAGWPLRPGCVR